MPLPHRLNLLLLLPLKFLLALILFPPRVLALPQGGQVTHGSATIQQVGDTKLNIHQTTDRVVINWHSFSIAPQEWVNFQQPSAHSAALNRVTSNIPSSIAGRLTANGQVFLINPNGIAFLPTAQVDVAGLVASTLNIKDSDFLRGYLRFEQVPGQSPAAVVNQGMITAREGGFVALVAPAVQNSGVISARLGQVVLAAGQGVTLDFYGDGLLSVTVDPIAASQIRDIYGNPLSALVDNQGRIVAPGGIVTLTAQAAGQVLDRVINVGGIIEARHAENRNGVIILSGGRQGTVGVTGTLDVSGERGGSIEITGQKVALQGAALIEASGHQGGGVINIGGSFQGQGPLPNAQEVTVGKDVQIKADAITSGNGGEVIVWSDGTTKFEGFISAKGGELSGNGGFAEVSGKEHLWMGGFADLSAPKGRFGTLLLDPGSITIQDGTGVNTGPNSFDDAYIITQLGLGNLTISTAAATNGAPETITILGNTDITWSANTTLTLLAGRNIIMNSGAVIQNTGGGSIVFEANQGSSSTAGNFRGIEINGTARLATNSGNITLRGRGGTTGNRNYGVLINGAPISVLPDTAPANIQSVSGNILIEGRGGSAGDDGYGVYVTRGARIQNTSGSITIDGRATSPEPAVNADGVFITTTPRPLTEFGDTATTMFRQTRILNHNGNISITGISDSSGNTSDGIAHWNALVRTTGTGNITYYGVSGIGTTNGNKDGLELQRHLYDSANPYSAEISATGAGHIFLTGVLRGGLGSDFAIKFGEAPTSALPNNAFVVRTFTGNICLNAENTGTASNPSLGWFSFRTAGATPIIESTSGGDIIIRGDKIQLNPGLTLNSTGILAIQPFTPGRNVAVLGSLPDTTHLSIDTTEFNLISTNFSQLVFGSSTAGTLTINGAINRNQHLTLEATNININSPINLGSNTLRLFGSGTINQTAAFTANSLILGGPGVFTLTNPSNNVNTIATALGTGPITYRDVDALTVGSVTLRTLQPFPTCCTSPSTNVTYSGIQTNNADAIIRTPSGSLTLNAASNLGSGNLTLLSNGGVTQNPTGGITAGGLGLQGTGTFDLNNASNDVNTFAAQVNGGVTFSDTDDLTIGTVTSTVGADTQSTSGLATNNNDAIVQTGGLLTLNKAANLGSGNLTLVSNGGVTQNATGGIIANGLGLQGTGTFDLNNASNDVNTFAAQVNGGVTFSDTDDLTIGTVTSTVGTDTATTVGLGTNGNDAIIQTSGLLTLNKAANLGSGNLTLVSNGGVTQNATGGIIANGLGLQGTGTFDLNNASNDVNTFAAQVNGGVTFSDTDDLTIGTVTSTVGTDTATTVGLGTNGNDAIIQTGNLLTLDKTANLGTGNLTLVSNGGVTQNPTGGITAGGLGLQGTGTFDLNNASNDVNTFAAQVNGGVTFSDTDDLTIGTVTSTVGTDTATTVGLGTNGNDAIIQTGNLLTLDKTANLGTGNLTLVSNGGVTQNATGGIIANGLGLQGTGTFDLNNASNDVNTFAAQVNGGVTFSDTDDLTIGTVTSTVGTDTATTVGLGTNGNDAIIQTGSLLTLDKTANLGTGNLTLVSGGGVTQNATGAIIANGLGLQGTGTFDLNNASNDVNAFAAQVNGGVTFSDTDDLTIGTVTSTVGTDTATTVGLGTNGNDAIIQTGNLLTLDKTANLGTGNLTLVSNGGVTQNPTGGITAGGLGLQGTGTFDLNNASNDVNTFAAQVNGGVTFSDTDDLTIGTVTSTVGTDTATTVGLSTNSNDAIIQTGNLLTLDKTANLGTGNLTLVSNGGVTQNPTGGITAGGLGLQGTGTFDLNNASNDVNTFAAQVNGGVTFSDTDDLTIGTVTSTVGTDTATTVGLGTNGNDAIIQTGNLLTLDKTANLGTGNLTLVSNGGVTQNPTGGITAGGLGLQGTGTFDLNNASNDVNTFAAQVNGGVTFSDTDDLTIGTVTSTVGTDTATTVGLSTNSNDAIIQTGNLLTLDKTANLGTGNLTLVSNGGVTQNPTGGITAGGLGLQGTGTFDLNNASNDVNTFAAQVNGGVTFSDTDDLTIGTVTSTVGTDTATTVGLGTNGNDAIIQTGSLLTLDKTANLGTGNLTLVSGGGVTQNATGAIIANGLGLQGTGTFDLNNASNDVNAFAAQVNGGVTFSDTDDLTIGTVTSTVGTDTATTVGLGTNGNDAIIQTGNLLTLDKTANLGTGNLTLVSNGGVTQNPTGGITAGGLGLQGTGTFDLNNASNDVNTFAAQVNGGVTFSDTDDLTIGTVTSTVGTDTATTVGLGTNGNDAIIQTGSLLTLDKTANLGTGNLTLVSNGGVTQNATGAIIANGLGLQGTGTFDLKDASNSINTFAAQVDGSVGIKNSQTLTVDTVTSTVGTDSETTQGINAKGSVFAQTQSGDVVLNKSIQSTATGNAITLVADNNFVNNVGNNALQAPNGRWLVYATSPSGNINGQPVLGGSEQFSTTYPQPALFSGNGFLYKVPRVPQPVAPVSEDTFNLVLTFNNRQWQYLVEPTEQLVFVESLVCTTDERLVNSEEGIDEKIIVISKQVSNVSTSQTRLEGDKVLFNPDRLSRCRDLVQ